MTQWTETRQKLIDEVHQSVQWKILQSNENGYRLDFPEVWSWVSQDEWMTEYNSKLRKLKKVAVAMSGMYYCQQPVSWYTEFISLKPLQTEVISKMDSKKF